MSAPQPSPTPPGPLHEEVSATVRGLAAAGAILVAVLVVQFAWNTLQRGYPWTAAAWVVAGLPVVVLLGVLGLSPGTLQGLLDGWLPLDLTDEGHVVTLAVLALTLFFVYGLGTLVDAVYGLEAILVHGRDLAELSDPTTGGILVGVLVSMLLFLLPPVLWVTLVRDQPVGELLPELGWRWGNVLRSSLVGVGIAVAAIAGLVLLALALQAVGVTLPSNERAMALAGALTIPTAFLVSLGAAVGEEVFFRGWLQPRVGLVWQAVLFSLAHLSYLNLLEVVVTFALGLAFGVALRRTGNLAAPVAGHFAFNFLMLLAVLTAPTSVAL